MAKFVLFKFVPHFLVTVRLMSDCSHIEQRYVSAVDEALAWPARPLSDRDSPDAHNAPAESPAARRFPCFDEANSAAKNAPDRHGRPHPNPGRYVKV
jgi:hypothetical protein